MNTTAARYGPHPGMVGAVAFTLMVVGLVVAGLLSGGDALSDPHVATSTFATRVSAHPVAWRASGLFQVGTAIPVAVYAAILHAHFSRLEVQVPGPTIGLVGGLIASTSLLASGVTTWVQGQTEITGSAAVVHALAYLALGFGGFGFVLGVGLMVAGAAVPGLVMRMLPRGVAIAGLVIAVLAELSWLGMVADPVTVLLPVGRFLGMLWLVAAGFLVGRGRRTTTEVRR